MKHKMRFIQILNPIDLLFFLICQTYILIWWFIIQNSQRSMIEIKHDLHKLTHQLTCHINFTNSQKKVKKNIIRDKSSAYICRDVINYGKEKSQTPYS